MYNAQFGNNYQECKCNDRENIGPPVLNSRIIPFTAKGIIY
jgi:hypothetical protein